MKFYKSEYLITWVFITSGYYKIIKDNPPISKNVVIIISFVMVPSSFLANNKEIIGEVLSKVHPIPRGSVLKTICWSKIPKLVPNKTEIIKIIFLFEFKLIKKKLTLNFEVNNKKMIAPSNLISVVIRGEILISKNTYLDSKPAETAHITDKNGYI